ncbi:MAG: TolC family protein [Deltaproteobacteria bacterium]|nr:MAG: TolC family protein [Deltaproteobacteria bacterium]
MSVLLIGCWLVGFATAAPAELGADDTYSVGTSQPIPQEPWWDRMGDERLSAYVHEALGRNPDLNRSRALVRQADGGRIAALAGFAPTLSAGGTTTIAPLESLGFGFGLPFPPDAPKTYVLGGATVNANLQVDAFGGGVASYRAASQDLQASRADLEGASLSIATLVSEAYYDQVVANARVRVIERQIQSNQELLEVLQLRYEGGEATALDVLQQRQQLASTLAQLPTAKLLSDTAGQRLAVLLGRLPTALPPAADALPDPPPDVPVGAPIDLIEHRPGLRAAAARTQSARDRRWSAKAALLPTLGVQGTTGYQFIDRGEFFDQTYWNAGANFTVPIFNGGRTYGGLRQAQATFDAQAAAFEGALLAAVMEVEMALAQERRQRESVEALGTQLDAAQQAYDAAKDQYFGGLTPYLNVQAALGRLQAAELSLLQGRRDLLSARISLHEALGGPWTADLGQERVR